MLRGRGPAGGHAGAWTARARSSYGPRDGSEETLVADAVLIATGGHPRELPDAQPDGERILNWTQVYDLDELPEELIVVGSGVTGAEFAGAYQALGSRVTLVSSRDRVLPGEDPDAAAVLEDVFRRRGMNVMARSRAASAKRVGDRVEVTLADGRVITGSHCLMAVGAIPNSHGHGPGGGRGQAPGLRAHLDRQGLPDHRPGRVRRRRRAPASSRSPPWPPCRAVSRCTTSSATRSPR